MNSDMWKCAISKMFFPACGGGYHAVAVADTAWLLFCAYGRPAYMFLRYFSPNVPLVKHWNLPVLGQLMINDEYSRIHNIRTSRNKRTSWKLLKFFYKRVWPQYKCLLAWALLTSQHLLMFISHYIYVLKECCIMKTWVHRSIYNNIVFILS